MLSSDQECSGSPKHMVVQLGINGEDLTLDISKCKKVGFYYDTAVKYREDVQRWAQRISWTVTSDDNDNDIIIIKRE